MKVVFLIILRQKISIFVAERLQRVADFLRGKPPLEKLLETENWEQKFKPQPPADWVERVRAAAPELLFNMPEYFLQYPEQVQTKQAVISAKKNETKTTRPETSDFKIKPKKSETLSTELPKTIDRNSSFSEQPSEACVKRSQAPLKFLKPACEETKTEKVFKHLNQDSENLPHKSKTLSVKSENTGDIRRANERASESFLIKFHQSPKKTEVIQSLNSESAIQNLTDNSSSPAPDKKNPEPEVTKVIAQNCFQQRILRSKNDSFLVEQIDSNVARTDLNLTALEETKPPQENRVENFSMFNVHSITDSTNAVSSETKPKSSSKIAATAQQSLPRAKFKQDPNLIQANQKRWVELPSEVDSFGSFEFLNGEKERLHLIELEQTGRERWNE